MADQLLTMRDVCVATGLKPSDVATSIRWGSCLPAKDSTGSGSYRGYSIENVLELSQDDELTKGGLSHRNAGRIVATQRAAIAHLSPAVRVLKRFEFFIETVTALTVVFGRGPGYDDWLARQQEQLATMRGELALDTKNPTRIHRRDRHLLKLLVEAKRARQDIAAPLAG